MKRIFLNCLKCAVLLWFAGTITSCSNNDDPDGPNGSDDIPSLPTPAYESSSAKYDITSSSTIESIELTASGDYIVIEKGGYLRSISDKKSTVKRSLLGGTTIYSTTRAGLNLISGKYIKLSDTEFLLEGFGSIVVEGSANNAYSLQVTPQNGETTTVSAKKASTMVSSTITDAVCRTWNLNTIKGFAKLGGKVLFNQTKSIKEYDSFWLSFYRAVDDEFEEDDYEPFGTYPSQVIFTKAGTYLVIYANDHLAISTWHWTDEKTGKLAYSWDYDDPDSWEYGNITTAYFTGKDLNIKEEPQEDEDMDIPGEAWWIFNMSEAI